MRQNIQNKCGLTRRSQAHSSTSKYSCQLCKATFANKGHYEGHINSHNNIKPFKCTYSAEFCFKSALLRHKKSCHGKTKVKPNSFRCEFCNSTFTRHDILQDHAKGKHENKKRYRCNKCISFAWRSSLSKHLMSRNIKKTMDLCWNKLEQYLEPWNTLYSLDNFIAFFFTTR